jgi:hypothetical protein
MSDRERVTVTLPREVLNEIDRLEKNRSRFVLVAVRHELERRRREELRRSLASPHAETAETADFGLGEWAKDLPEELASELIDVEGGSPVRWEPGVGWVEEWS